MIPILEFLLPFVGFCGLCLWGYWCKVDPWARRLLGWAMGVSVQRDAFGLWLFEPIRPADWRAGQEAQRVALSAWGYRWRTVACWTAQRISTLCALSVSALIGLMMTVMLLEIFD